MISDERPRVGVIGLGAMGAGMARNIAGAGLPLVVWNRTAARTEPFAARGVRVADSPAALAAEVDVVLTCVSDSPDVEEVLMGAAGVATAARPGLLVVDSSTISPAVTRAIAARLGERDIAFVDAPVSGGIEGAARGRLTVMVGGAEADVARARPVLEAIGDTITHLGPVGAGQTCKLVNQVLVVVTMLGVGEALLLASAGGLDLEQTVAAVSGGAGGSWMLANRAPQVLARDWAGFSIDLQQKDLRLVLEQADDVGVPMIGTATVFQLLRTLQARGLGDHGNHALVLALERLAGREIGGPA